MNLLEETIQDLKDRKRQPSDVLWVGTRKAWFTWEDFEALAKTAEYDDGFGSQQVAQDLMIMGKDFHMDRHEYDGSECWHFHTQIEKPSRQIKPTALTIDQAIALKRDVSCGWEDLEALNNNEA
jgi:hypothetical protein